MSIKAIFLDLGDTIVDLGEGRADYGERLAARAGRVYEVLAAARVRLPERTVFCHALAEGCEARYQAALAEQRGLTMRAALASFFDELAIPVTGDLLDAGVDAYCIGGEARSPLRLGAKETLERLHADGLRLGVISNTIQPGHYMDDSLRRHGLLHLFATRTYSSEAGVAKPHPGIFQAALATMGVAPTEAVHVGDRLAADVLGAQGAGMKAILIRVAMRVEADLHITPDATIDELSELPAALACL